MIRWMYAFLDRPRTAYDQACAFWAAVTGATRSAPRGDAGEFATLLPADGDPYLKTQAVGDDGGTHLDLCVDDVDALRTAALALGAAAVAEQDGYHVLRSPGGVVFCSVPWHGELTRPGVRTGPHGERSRLDQVCLDVAAEAADAEVDFWARLTGWQRVTGSLPEFTVVQSPAGAPLRLLVQRLGTGAPGAHLDLACGADIAAVRAAHEALGATVDDERPSWTVLRDPAGVRYCLTGRNQDTGLVRR
jgi:catechol 2,3-dioxygenase-like lactoylglutathione lyase family enzyme